MNTSPLNQRARSLAVWALAGLGFALPLPPAWASMMLVLMLVGWLGSGQWQTKWQTVRQAPAAKAALAFLALVVLGLLYGEQGHGGVYLAKYASLLLLPVILSLQLTPAERNRAALAFCCSMTFVLLLSFLISLTILPAEWFRDSSPGNPTVFKLQITHGLFMVLAAFILYIKSMTLPSGKARYGLWLLAALMVGNALFMVQGRTGQLALIVLVVFLFSYRTSRHGLLIGISAAFALSVLAYTSSDAFKQRADRAVMEVQNWKASESKGDPSSSMGTRLDFYKTSLLIIRDHPWIGTGTGGFGKAYEKEIAGTTLPFTLNPHNQYLLVAAQYGLLGLGVLALFYFSCWRQARQTPEPYRILALGFLLAYLCGNMFNSFMLDFAERLLFYWAMGIFLVSSSPNTLSAETP